MFSKTCSTLLSSVLMLGVSVTPVLASGSATGEGQGTHSAMLLITLALILIGAKFFHLIEKAKQPSVIGELFAGILLGNLSLFGFSYFTKFQHNEILAFLSELGVIILLFQIGLESNARELIKVGTKSLSVAAVGAVLPFTLSAFVVAPLLLPEAGFNTHIFIGATLIATAVGISARVFKDAGLMRSKPAKIFLGATITDDVISLVMLAVVSALVTSGHVSSIEVGLIIAKAILFLLSSVLLGQVLAPYLGYVFSLINTGAGTKFTLSISFCLIFAAIAQLIGMEPVIGAFAAGLVLDPVHFKRFEEPHIVKEIKKHLSPLNKQTRETINEVLDKHAERSVEDIIEPLSLFFIPIFFVLTGMQVNLSQLFDVKILLLAAALSVVAFLTKLASGFVLKGEDRWIVGLAMVPRGEVGLIFANIGLVLGVLSDQVFSVLVVTILVTTILAPAMLSQKIKAE